MEEVKKALKEMVEARNDMIAMLDRQLELLDQKRNIGSETNSILEFKEGCYEIETELNLLSQELFARVGLIDYLINKELFYNIQALSDSSTKVVVKDYGEVEVFDGEDKERFIGREWCDLSKYEMDYLLSEMEINQDDIDENESGCVITLTNGLRIPGSYARGYAIYPYETGTIEEGF